MRYLALAALAALTLTALTLAACGGDDDGGGGGDAGDFMEELLTQITHGQYGRAYETMHPAQQEFVDREFYERCANDSGLMPQLEDFNVVEVYEEDAPIRGTDLVEPSTAVTYEMTLSAGDEERTVTDTSHLFEVEGEWRWIWSGGEAAAEGNCP